MNVRSVPWLHLRDVAQGDTMLGPWTYDELGKLRARAAAMRLERPPAVSAIINFRVDGPQVVDHARAAERTRLEEAYAQAVEPAYDQMEKTWLERAHQVIIFKAARLFNPVWIIDEYKLHREGGDALDLTTPEFMLSDATASLLRHLPAVRNSRAPLEYTR